MSISLVGLVSFTMVTFLHVALGEQAPKTLAIRSPKAVALWTAPPLLAIYYIFWPVIWLLNNASRLTLRLMGLGRPDPAELAHTEEELRHIVAESVAGGHLSRRERVMIENVLNLEEKTARRVMVPRPDIVYLSLSRPLEDNLRIARQAGHTRYPLCEDDLTTVIGMIHVKDLFRAGPRPTAGSTSASGRDRCRFSPRRFISTSYSSSFSATGCISPWSSTSTAASSAWSRSKTCLRNSSARSRTSSTARRPRSRRWVKEIFEVDAACPLDTLAEACGIPIPETEAETAGGLVLDMLGRLAKIGDSVTVDGHRLTVLRADPTRIRRIRVEPLVEVTPETRDEPD